jgi:hypothetical protein
MMKWLSFVSLALLLTMPPMVFGQGLTVARQFKGKPNASINVGVFVTVNADCTSGPLPVIRLATAPQHGQVTVKRGRLQATNLKQCLGADLPAFVAVYRSAPNYIGKDEFAIEVIAANGKKQIQQITVTLTKDGNSQGI